MSFTAKAGTTTALVGHSGSGKSTTASLIPRFYDVQQGAVKIGGVDIREIPHADLMKMVAFVFQDPKLFKDTLLENIRAGRPSATREEVLQAAHLAQCDDILEKFPDGIDTVVGSKGVYLSGGETQRIAIARAILKDAPIVVLDEATAYADPENEQQIQKAFEGLVKGKTGHAEIDMITSVYAHILDEDRKINAQKFESAFYAKPDLRAVRPPEEPREPVPATLDLETLVEQLRQSPELANTLAALLSAAPGGR